MKRAEARAPIATIIKPTTPSPKIRWAIFLAIALLALAVRLPQLGERPMHTDEAVNAYITGELLGGKAYHYDPQDRHGPALYLLAEPIAKLGGAKNFSELTESQLRLSTVITGAATVLLFGAGVELFGFIACLVAALLFAFAPLPVYYSRYFIHETFFVAATFGLILCASRMPGWGGSSRCDELTGRSATNSTFFTAALAGLCAALMLACKETAVIHFFALAVALVVCRFGAPASSPERTDNHSKLAGSETGVPIAKSILTAFAVFVVATILLFTWFGQHWSGLTDLFRAIPRFAARAGGEGHAKLFDYYFHLLDPLWILFIVAAAGIFTAFCDAVSARTQMASSLFPPKGGAATAVMAEEEAGLASVQIPSPQPSPRSGGERESEAPRPAGLTLVVYALIVGLIYSVIPYKQPWLTLNLWLPFALLCGLGVAAIFELIKNPAGRWGAGVAGVLLLATLGAQTKEYCFDKPADEKNPYAYAHTGEDLLRLPGRLEELARKRNISNPRIAVVMADAWPLPWYLRNFPNTGFWQPGQETGAADFFITSTDVSDRLSERLEKFRPEFFGVQPNVLLLLWSPPSKKDRATDAARPPQQP